MRCGDSHSIEGCARTTLPAMVCAVENHSWLDVNRGLFQSAPMIKTEKKWSPLSEVLMVVKN